MKQIITHDGQFHADEIFAIALLFEIIGEVPILRTRNIKIEDIDNPETWILDVGMQYDSVLHNFDHHQDATHEATNMLVLRALSGSRHIKEELFDELYSKFTTISAIDKNGTASFNGFQINTLIKSFNQLPNGWDLALNVARAVVQSAIENLKQKQLFKLHTRDSKELSLIPTGKELFFHNNGFLAIYDTEQDAFEACNLLETRDLPLKKNLQID